MTTSSPLRMGRSMGVLLAGILVFHAGWYMLLPYVAVLFTGRRGFSPSEVGVVLAAQSFAILVGSIAGGQLADRYGRKRTLMLGLLLRAVGVAALGFSTWLQTALLAAAVAGFGGGIYGPAAKAALSMMASEENRTQIFSMRGIAANIGTSLGPLLGLIFVRGPIAVLFVVAGLIHLALGAATWSMLEERREVNRTTHTPYRDTVADWPFFLFSMVTVLAWALFAQLAISVPLWARQVLGLEAMVGLLWTISSIVVIGGQFFLSRYVLERIHPITAMVFGSLLLGGGLGLVYYARNFTGLVGAVLVFVVGEMFIVPTSDAVVSRMARSGAIGSYFGVASFAWGLGEGSGNLTGGLVMHYAFANGMLAVPWLFYAASGASIAGLYLALRLWTPLGRRLAPAEAEPEAVKPFLYRTGHPAPEEGVLLGPPRQEEE